VPNVATDPDSALQQALQAIPGIDLSFGLKVVRGRLASYKRLLGKLAENHGDDFALIRQRLAAGDTEEARRLAHSLKGAAGSLGAMAIQVAAAALETAIREQQPISQIDPLIEQTATEYRALQDALTPLFESDVPVATSMQSVEQLAPLLSQVYELLAVCEMNVQPLVRSEQEKLSPVFGDQLGTFNNLVASFDFDGALALLTARCKLFPQLAATLPKSKD
jgi:two-component system sensor histidine kinase/response regulator